MPERVLSLLRLHRSGVFSALADGYSFVGVTGLRPLARRLLVQPRYWSEVEKFDRSECV